MGENYSEIQELLQQRADIQARLNLIDTINKVLFPNAQLNFFQK